jgi:hypothetical protein
VTPIQLDLTARRLLKRMRSWRWELPKPGRAAEPQRAAEQHQGASRRTRRRAPSPDSPAAETAAGSTVGRAGTDQTPPG